MTETAEVQFHEGDEVRLPDGRVVVLDEAPNPNPNYAEDDETWSSAHEDGDGGFGHIDILSAEGITLVRSAADMAKRELPTVQDIRDAVSSALIGMWSDDLDVNQTDHDGEDAIECYGKAKNGLQVYFRVQISDIERVDA